MRTRLATYLKSTFTLLAGAFALTATAQDAMLSQYWAMPSLVNPANTGLTETDYRAVTGYRNQWASVSSPFTTAQAAFDTRFANRSGNALGVGGFVRNDRIETASFNTFEASGQAAYHLNLVKDKILSFGLSAGWRQRSINFDDLAWDSQYNGVAYDPTIDSGEAFAGDAKGSLDAAFGFNFRNRGRSNFDVGYGVWHYFQNQGFLIDGNDRAIIRQNVIFSWYDTYNNIDVIYDFIGARQGGAMMFMGGARAFYRMGNDSRYTNATTSNAITAGVHYRWADAAIVSVGYQYQRSLTISAAYDLTVSRLSQTNRMRGAWELMLTWEGWYTDKRVRLR